MKKGKTIQNNFSRKESVQAGGSGLAIGLSLGVLAGIIIDDIGLGMMLGVAVGLCIGSAVGVLQKNKKEEDQKHDGKQ